MDDLLAGRGAKGVFSKDGFFDELKKALAERVLNAELDIISTMLNAKLRRAVRARGHFPNDEAGTNSSS